jgi:hypothetical protein
MATVIELKKALMGKVLAAPWKVDNILQHQVGGPIYVVLNNGKGNWHECKVLPTATVIAAQATATASAQARVTAEAADAAAAKAESDKIVAALKTLPASEGKDLIMQKVGVSPEALVAKGVTS